MIPLALFEETRTRIRTQIARTNLVRIVHGVVPEGNGVDEHGVISMPALDDRLDRDVWLKLECLQVTGSFKARGALNRVLSLPPGRAARGIVTASGGNHGVAVAFAGRAVGAPTTIYLPSSASAQKARRIEGWGARVVRVGDVWDEAHAAALAHATAESLTYVHPFADPEVVAGQGTVALELFEQAPTIDTLVIAVGGGGLIAGVASVAKKLMPSIRVIGVEPTGAPTLHESLRANEVIELPTIESRAGTLAPRKSDPYTFAIVREVVDEIVLVTDEEMEDAARFLLTHVGVGVELAGAAALAAVLTRRVDLRSARTPCVLVCGAA